MEALSGKDTGGSLLKKLNVFKRFTPAQVLVLGFALLILTGGGILTLPISSATGQPVHFVDALFTSTSAVCVTGLIVVDTGTRYSVFGQVIIMLLIQIGGLGFMTMATLFALIMRKRIFLRERLIMQEAYNQLTVEGVVKLARRVLLITVLIEGAGAVILGLRWSAEYGLARGFWYGLFHSVSSFNNAGFDLFGGFRSLTLYKSDFTVNIVVSFLIILGGIGFGVMLDIYRRRNWRKLSLHTKVVLTTTAILLAVGTLGVFFLEYNNAKTLASLNLPDKILASWFQSVTPRTAGYNTIDIGGMRSATQFLFVMLMFIGASPGSTGGGIKTTTFGTLVLAVWAMVRGREDIEIYKRRLAKEIVIRSLAISTVALGLVIFVTMLLTITENAEFLAVLFETTSAFGTVGLTMGITPKLTIVGKLAIMLTMYLGRVGPLTVAFALAQKQQKAIYRLAEEKIMVG